MNEAILALMIIVGMILVGWCLDKSQPREATPVMTWTWTPIQSEKSLIVGVRFGPASTETTTVVTWTSDAEDDD